MKYNTTLPSQETGATAGLQSISACVTAREQTLHSQVRKCRACGIDGHVGCRSKNIMLSTIKKVFRCISCVFRRCKFTPQLWNLLARSRCSLCIFSILTPSYQNFPRSNRAELARILTWLEPYFPQHFLPRKNIGQFYLLQRTFVGETLEAEELKKNKSFSSIQWRNNVEIIAGSAW